MDHQGSSMKKLVVLSLSLLYSISYGMESQTKQEQTKKYSKAELLLIGAQLASSKYSKTHLPYKLYELRQQAKTFESMLKNPECFKISQIKNQADYVTKCYLKAMPYITYKLDIPLVEWHKPSKT